MQQRRQQQYRPDADTTEQADDETAARGAPPVQQPDNAGQELGNRNERNEAEFDQTLAVLESGIETVAGHDDQANQQPAAPQDPAVQVHRRVRVAGGQQQVVQAHRGQRDAGHDDHGAGRRQSADECQQRQPRRPVGKGDAQHEVVGVDRQAAFLAGPQDHRYRDVEQKQKCRHRPGRGAQPPCVEVFREQHVELPWQQERCGERQKHQGAPGALVDRAI